MIEEIKREQGLSTEEIDFNLFKRTGPAFFDYYHYIFERPQLVKSLLDNDFDRCLELCMIFFLLCDYMEHFILIEDELEIERHWEDTFNKLLRFDKKKYREFDPEYEFINPQAEIKRYHEFSNNILEKISSLTKKGQSYMIPKISKHFKEADYEKLKVFVLSKDKNLRDSDIADSYLEHLRELEPITDKELDSNEEKIQGYTSE